jgi:uncharacterized membrane protein SpoIIM required for sporulation
MSAQVFFYALAAGAAGLALWILVRFAGFGPRSLVWAGVHAVLAYTLLRVAPIIVHAVNASETPTRQFVAVFGFALPMFVYAFLSGGWVTRVALGQLRR